VQNTSLNPRHVRNGLGVLVQQNLLYYHKSPDSRATNYEANHSACYNLIRYGKILEIVDSQYGSAERDLVQTLMLLGHAKIADLSQAYSSRAPKVNGYTNGSHEPSSGQIASEGSLQSVLGRLIQAGIIETVRPDSFRNPAEVYQEIKADVTKVAPGDRATSKDKEEQQRRIVDRFRTFKEQSSLLKRQLDQNGGPVNKKRKLEYGKQQNGRHNDYSMTELNVSIAYSRPLDVV
jgi:DNA-directed RNA polymerase III subunit RPC3